MIFFVVGLPDYFTNWCERFVAVLAAGSGAPAEILHANLPREICRQMLEHGAVGSKIVLSINQPGGRLRAALAESQRPYLVILDNPINALCELICDKGQRFDAALRLAASSAAATVGCTFDRHAMVLRNRPRDDDVHGLCTAIAHHMEMPCTEAMLEWAVEAWKNFSHDRVYEWRENLDVVQRRVTQGVLGAFIHSEPNVPSRFYWPPCLFVGPNGASLENVVDITGRARNLITGPGLTLPPGAWRLVLELAFFGGALEHNFKVSVCAGKVLSTARVLPSHEGGLNVAVDFQIDHSVDDPVTVEISLDRAAFDGTIELRGATVDVLQ